MTKKKHIVKEDPMSRGITASFVMHMLAILSLLVGMPDWLKSDRMELPPVMTVEIVNVADITNLKPTPPKSQTKKEEEPKPEPKKEVEQQEPQPTPQPDPTPPPPPEKKPAEKKPEPQKKPEEKPKPAQEKQKPKTPEKTEKKTFDEILKDLAKESKAQATDEPEVRGDPQYDASKPLSVNHIDYIRSKMTQCWNVPAGIMNAKDLVVEIKLQLLPNGTVRDVQVVNRLRMAADPQFRAAAESAVRAVRLCSPFDKLPADRYPSWQEITFTFDPSAMLY